MVAHLYGVQVVAGSNPVAPMRQEMALLVCLAVEPGGGYRLPHDATQVPSIKVRKLSAGGIAATAGNGAILWRKSEAPAPASRALRSPL